MTAPTGQNRSQGAASSPTCILAMSNEEGDRNEISATDPSRSSLVYARMKQRCCPGCEVRGKRIRVESDEDVVSSTADVIQKIIELRTIQLELKRSSKFRDQIGRESDKRCEGYWMR